MIRSDSRKKQAILIAAILLIAVLLTATAPASAKLLFSVNKTVYDSDSSEWVKALTAELNDTLRFNCTIMNTAGFNLTEVRFWDVLDCSLDFAGNSTLTNASGVVTDINIYGNLKPKVLHPQNLSWNLSVPEGEYFDELCPEPQVRKAVCWEDTDYDNNVSACDQIRLTGPYPGTRWYHVDRVPYTLTLSNETYGTKYFDSVLDWDDPGMNLSDPLNSTWLEVCCCKDRYALLEWIDLSCPGFGSGDTVTMQNERTGEVIGYYIENITKDLVVSREFGIDSLLDLETFILESGQTITIEYDATVVDCGVDNNTFHAKGLYCPDACEWVYSNEAKVTITVPCPELEVNKTVYDPVNETWVKELTAKIDDILQFTCTITNTGKEDLEQIRFWDILDCSLKYQCGSFVVNNTPISIGDAPWFRFKPHVLHPESCELNLSNPVGCCNFTELYPPWHHTRQIVAWNDTYPYDGNLSACDQVQLYNVNRSTYKWYHVDRVPYTLNLSNAKGSKYFDSVLDWDGVNLSDPVNSTWFYLCGCKDQYTLIDWECKNCPASGISPCDNVTMRNERTGEEAEYTVEDITKDLVVSREYEMDNLLYPDTLILEPGETITIEYNATVVSCGVDNNTFRAKGNWSSGEAGAWEYSNEDRVTITVPCPSGDAADGTPTIKDVFTAGEPVYALAHNFAPNKSVDIYITPVRTWKNGDIIADYARVGPVHAQADADGNIGINPKVLMWPNPVPGEYHMVFDDPDGDFDLGDDLADWFSVVGAVPALTPLGLVALIGLLSILATSTLLKKRKKR